MTRWLFIILAVIVGWFLPTAAHAHARMAQAAYDAGPPVAEVVLVAGITMDTDEGDNEEPQSLHKYVYCAGNPVNNSDLSGNDYFGNTFESSSQIFSQMMGMVGLQSGKPIKTVGDADIDGQLGWVYNKIEKWAKKFGPINHESINLWHAMMAGGSVDTKFKVYEAEGYDYQYDGTKYPLLQNRTFSNSDINYIGFGEGFSAYGAYGTAALDVAVNWHLWADYNSLTIDHVRLGIGKRPSDNTLAAAYTGYDWGLNKFFPNGPRHGSGN